jgi:hypothetical protein
MRLPEEQRESVTKLLAEILNELAYADSKYKHDPMSSAEIGLATIKCEIAELEREVLRPIRNNEWLKKECVQVCAMGVKFLRDICNNES